MPGFGASTYSSRIVQVKPFAELIAWNNHYGITKATSSTKHIPKPSLIIQIIVIIFIIM